MNIKGDKIIVSKPLNEVCDFAKNPTNHKQLMPDELEKFEADEHGYFFQIKGMPGIALKRKESDNPNEVIYTSAKDSLVFDLKILLTSLNENQTEVQLEFDGKFNPFIKMMVEKPLTSFIQSLSNKLHTI